MDLQSLILKLHRHIRMQKSKISKHLTVTPEWLLFAGKHWLIYGMLPAEFFKDDNVKVRFNPLLGFAISISILIKHLLILWFNTYRSDQTIIAGDIVGAAISNRVCWFYINICLIICPVYVLDFYVNRYLEEKPDMAWLQVFLEVSRFRLQTVQTIIGDRSSQLKFLKITALASKFLTYIAPLAGLSYIVCINIPYLLALNEPWHFFVGIFYTLQFYLFCYIFCQFIFIKSVYFLLLNLFVKYSLAIVCKKLLNEAKFVKIASEVGARKHLRSESRISNQLDLIRKCYRLTLSCNNYVSQRLKPLLTATLALILAYTYVFSNAESFLDFAVSFVVLFNCYCFLIFFFVSASLVTLKIKQSYKILNKLQCLPLSLKTKTKILTFIELIASKRRRFGFEIKNWFRLNTLQLIKVS